MSLPFVNFKLVIPVGLVSPDFFLQMVKLVDQPNVSDQNLREWISVLDR